MLFEGQFIVLDEHDDAPLQFTWPISNVELLHDDDPLQFIEVALRSPLLLIQAELPLQCSCSVEMLFTLWHDDDPLQFSNSSAFSKPA